MTNFDWTRFAGLTSESAHWPLMERAASMVGHAGRALDLGAGGGRDTKYLLTHGWQVTAVDSEPASIALLSQMDDPNLTVVQSAIQDFPFGRAEYDLVNAQFSLPFVPAGHFEKVIERIKEALKPGGLFTGIFFGPHDEWNTPGSSVTFLPREKVDELLTGMSVIEFTEEDAVGSTAFGETKHWHVYRVIARRSA